MLGRRTVGSLSVRAVVALAIAAMLGVPGSAQTNNQCDQPGESPDVIVSSINDVVQHGSIGGITAFSFGTSACNVGTCWLHWIASTNEHPVIAQNVYRLKSGRFEQIGQSWLKHAFFALQRPECSTVCLPSSTGARLGVGCSDPYTADVNGDRERLGPKFEVAAFRGEFPYPSSWIGPSGDAIYKRLQIHDVDLDPALNAGASYFVEAQYVARDDAVSGNGGNNASYAPLVEVGTTTFFLAVSGATVQTKPAIEAWKAADPDVLLTLAQVPQDGRFYVGSRATDLGGGTWRYEYAVHNLDVDRSAGTFHVPIPPGVSVTNLGFHDVDYHSGEPYSGADWTATVSGNPPNVGWSTDAYVVTPDANALRWGTLYNFRFDAEVAPTTGSVVLGLFLPGAPDAISVAAVAPRLCDDDGICDPGESCERCPDDCHVQSGGAGCCGNGTCETGESPCACASDCGTVAPSEAACGDLRDDDCDGAVDCHDVDCCHDGACLAADADGDLHPGACDCDDADGTAWGTPGEVPRLTAREGPLGTQLIFDPPTSPGGTVVQYELIRSSVPWEFLAGTTCIGATDPTQPMRNDPDLPDTGELFHYLVRARNACADGEGPLGTDSSGVPHFGACP